MQFNGSDIPDDIVPTRANADLDTVGELSTALSELLQMAALAKLMELAVALGGFGKDRELLRVALFMITDQFSRIANEDLSLQLTDIRSNLK